MLQRCALRRQVTKSTKSIDNPAISVCVLVDLSFFQKLLPIFQALEHGLLILPVL
jgi:hypothetical protein